MNSDASLFTIRLAVVLFSRGSRSLSAQWLELVQSLIYFCKARDLYLERRQQTSNCNCFLCQKKKKAGFCWNSHSCVLSWRTIFHKKTMGTFTSVMLCSTLWRGTWSSQSAPRILNNFPQKQQQEGFFFLFFFSFWKSWKYFAHGKRWLWMEQFQVCLGQSHKFIFLLFLLLFRDFLIWWHSRNFLAFSSFW